MAQTINVANIKVGLDIEQLKKNGDFTRTELAFLARTVRAAEDPFLKLARDI
jgi:hypothetical protein